MPNALQAGAVLDGVGPLRVSAATGRRPLAYPAAVVSAVSSVLRHAALFRLGHERTGLFADVVPIGAALTTVVLGLVRPSSANLAVVAPAASASWVHKVPHCANLFQSPNDDLVDVFHRIYADGSLSTWLIHHVGLR